MTNIELTDKSWETARPIEDDSVFVYEVLRTLAKLAHEAISLDVDQAAAQESFEQLYQLIENKAVYGRVPVQHMYQIDGKVIVVEMLVQAALQVE